MKVNCSQARALLMALLHVCSPLVAVSVILIARSSFEQYPSVAAATMHLENGWNR